MPRSPRLQFADAYYHVINRGLAKKDIFVNDKSYQIFLEILGESCIKFGVTIHAYCLMTNHYHLLAQTPNANLSKFMQRLSSVYTKNFNNVMNIDGPLFRGRFKSSLIEDDSYSVELSRYIHRNPVNLVSDLKNYKWSSYRTYIGLEECPSWLNVKETLQMFNMSKDNYEKFINEGV